MHIEQLEGSSFRNLERFALTLSPRWVVVRGPNAQGKTNLLEALYVAATGRSFRHAPAKDLLRHGEPAARLRAVLSRQGVRHEVEVNITPHGRNLTVDGRHLRQTAKLLELVNVVAFFPDDLRIIKGSPEERRRFVDRAIANHRPDFVTAAFAYAAALKQRNALLKAPSLDRRLLEAYDAPLVSHGAVVQRAREEVLAALAPGIAAHFRAVMGVEHSVDVSLSSGLPEASHGDAYATTFAASLSTGFGRDRARGQTLAGPHRADLLVRIDGEDARSFASQGQQRALVLAMKLAELAYLGEKLASPPVLLLDDVSSELDRDRTQALFTAIGAAGCQVWVSTTGAAPLPVPSDAQIFEVRNGEITPAATGSE